jgi:1-acyl-sn-glycerol-3-phosphate acyltransferase
MAANRIFCHNFHEITTFSPSQLPRKGAAILVCNHISGLDPMLVQAASPRLVIWMMAKEYYDIKALTWLYKLVDAIPVERSGRDLTATRAALRALNQGRVLGVFPEGKLETSRDLLPFQTGVALMAIKTGVPVYPAYLDGTQRGKAMVAAISRANHATLRFGPPIDISGESTSKESLERATDAIQQAVQRLKVASEAGNGELRS